VFRLRCALDQARARKRPNADISPSAKAPPRRERPSPGLLRPDALHPGFSEAVGDDAGRVSAADIPRSVIRSAKTAI